MECLCTQLTTKNLNAVKAFKNYQTNDIFKTFYFLDFRMDRNTVLLKGNC